MGEIITNTETTDKTTLYRPGLSPEKVYKVDEEGGVPAKNDKIVNPIETRQETRGHDTQPKISFGMYV